MSGCAAQCTIHEINDIAFVGVSGAGRRARLRPVGRRRPVHQPDDRQEAGRVRPAGPGPRGLGRGQRRYSATTATGGCGTGPGSSSSWPTGARSGSARCSRRDYLGYALADGPAPEGAGQRACATTSACTSSGTAGTTWASRRAVGRMSADALDAGRRPGRPSTAAAGCAPPPSRRWSSWTCRRPGPAALAAELDAAGLPATPSAFRRHTMACTGIEFCKLAIVETKARASDLIAELERRLPGLHRAGHHQRQRLPELLRPDPDRRHRPQGLAGHRGPTASRSRDSRSTWAAAWTAVTATAPASAGRSAG